MTHNYYVRMQAWT